MLPLSQPIEYGGGGTGGTTGSGSGPNTGGLPPLSGETLGFPNWFPFPQGNIWNVLLPPGASCEFVPCSFHAGTITWGARIAKWAWTGLSVTESLGLGALEVLLLQKGDAGPQARHRTDTQTTSEAQRCQQVREQCAEKCWEDDQKVPKYRGQDTFLQLRKCVRQCMETHGCFGY